MPEGQGGVTSGRGDVAMRQGGVVESKSNHPKLTSKESKNMSEDNLIKELKQGNLRRVYYLYGKEIFLVETYAKRILDKCGLDDDDVLNLARFKGGTALDVSAVAEFVETLPVFADKRVAMLNDVDAEKLDKDSHAALLNTLSNVPESTCVIIYMTGFYPDLKKSNTKKLLACIEESGKGATVEFAHMGEGKTAELITRRVSRAGCTISRNNAEYLSGLCLRNLTLIAAEVDKLCAHADYQGEITRKAIDTLTAKQLDSVVFALSTEIIAKKGTKSLRTLNELLEQGNAPVMIMSVLSSTFIDFYRAKVGSRAGKTSRQIAKDFAYPPNRVWLIDKAMTTTARLPLEKLRRCVEIVCDADFKLKSSPATMSDKDKVVIERAISELLTLW